MRSIKFNNIILFVMIEVTLSNNMIVWVCLGIKGQKINEQMYEEIKDDKQTIEP